MIYATITKCRYCCKSTEMYRATPLNQLETLIPHRCPLGPIFSQMNEVAVVVVVLIALTTMTVVEALMVARVILVMMMSVINMMLAVMMMIEMTYKIGKSLKNRTPAPRLPPSNIFHFLILPFRSNPIKLHLQFVLEELDLQEPGARMKVWPLVGGNKEPATINLK